MKNNRKNRRYILSFVEAGMWLASLCFHLSSKKTGRKSVDLLTVLLFLNVVGSTALGIVESLDPPFDEQEKD